MAERETYSQLQSLIVNNCKVANELRKYRDLANFVNVAAEAGDEPKPSSDYTEYVISQNLSYWDMMVADAAYTLWKCRNTGRFQAETIAQVMAGHPKRRLTDEARRRLEDCLIKLSQTQIALRSGHNRSMENNRVVYEGDFLPIAPVSGKARKSLSFRFLPHRQMPLYQYADDHSHQLIEIPFSLLQGAPSMRHTDTALMLCHCLLHELSIVFYPKNRVAERKLMLLYQDAERNECGLLWRLGLFGRNEKDLQAAQSAQRTMCRLLDSWKSAGYLTSYQALTPAEGFGIRITADDKGPAWPWSSKGDARRD